jgi:hypothetical protein
LWLVSGNKRLAYTRIPARKLLYSMVEEERGEQCGAVKRVFLKVSVEVMQSSQGWRLYLLYFPLYRSRTTLSILSTVYHLPPHSNARTI